jgi:hypothetical protein
MRLNLNALDEDEDVARLKWVFFQYQSDLPETRLPIRRAHYNSHDIQILYGGSIGVNSNSPSFILT